MKINIDYIYSGDLVRRMAELFKWVLRSWNSGTKINIWYIVYKKAIWNWMIAEMERILWRHNGQKRPIWKQNLFSLLAFFSHLWLLINSHFCIFLLLGGCKRDYSRQAKYSAARPLALALAITERCFRQAASWIFAFIWKFSVLRLSLKFIIY